jgi:hypothetical protein
MDRKYQAEEDLRTLTRANEIQGDTARMRRASGVAKKQMQGLRSIAGRRS